MRFLDIPGSESPTSPQQNAPLDATGRGWIGENRALIRVSLVRSQRGPPIESPAYGDSAIRRYGSCQHYVSSPPFLGSEHDRASTEAVIHMRVKEECEDRTTQRICGDDSALHKRKRETPVEVLATSGPSKRKPQE